MNGAQCSVTDGSTKNIVGGTYQPKDYNPYVDSPDLAHAALYADGVGGVIYGVGMTINDPKSYDTWIDDAGYTIFIKNYGIYAKDGGIIDLKNTSIATNENGSSEVLTVTGVGSKVFLDNVVITPTVLGVNVQAEGYLKLLNSTVEDGGLITLQGSSAVDLVNSHAFGIQFGFAWNGSKDTSVNEVNMQGGFLGQLYTLSGENIFNVTGGVVGYENFPSMLAYVGSVEEMGRGGSTLLDNGSLTINAHASQLYGATEMGKGAYLGMNLTGGSIWTTSTIFDGRKTKYSSDVSVLNIDNSTVKFGAPFVNPMTGDLIYGTINVGGDNTKGATDVYTSNNGTVIFNTFVNDGGLPSNQFTDKLVIKGDVAGKTQIKVNEMVGSTGDVDWTSNNGTNLTHEGISLIQITGKAEIDSFGFAGGYTTFHRQPYVYKLYGFEDAANGTWDFRLQNEWLWDGDDWRRQVVPQVSSYLTAPNALFRARSVDLSNLHERMGDMRREWQGEKTPASASSAGIGGADSAEVEEKERKRRRNLFLRAYGGKQKYQTDLAILEYGYNADINYGAVQFGGNLFGFERERDEDNQHNDGHKDAKRSEWIFGLSGSYGALSFKTDREDSRETKMDVYAITPYLTWLKDNGFYADFVVSIGKFDGKVATKRYDQTAKLQGTSLAVSVNMGMPFDIGSHGWSFEPQAQLTYQKLSFNAQEDADNFPIKLGSPMQMMGRIGGKLMKDKFWSDARKLMIYGKLNYIHDFSGDNHEVWLGDDFQVGKAGRHIEAGLGLNLSMMRKLSLFGDLTWTQPVGSVGNKGISFDAGANLKF